jgi:hypothetical protein
MNPELYCDRCGAQAKNRFILDSGDLVFCGHHTNEYKDKLEEIDAVVDPFFEDYKTDLVSA